MAEFFDHIPEKLQAFIAEQKKVSEARIVRHEAKKYIDEDWLLFENKGKSE